MAPCSGVTQASATHVYVQCSLSSEQPERPTSGLILQRADNLCCKAHDAALPDVRLADQLQAWLCKMRRWRKGCDRRVRANKPNVALRNGWLSPPTHFVSARASAVLNDWLPVPASARMYAQGSQAAAQSLCNMPARGTIQVAARGRVVIRHCAIAGSTTETPTARVQPARMRPLASTRAPQRAKLKHKRASTADRDQLHAQTCSWLPINAARKVPCAA